MRELNAREAIGPAQARTRLVMTTAFRASHAWKLSFLELMAAAGTFFSPLLLLLLGYVPSMAASRGYSAALAFAAAVFFATLAYLGVLYLSTRMRFASFDMIANCSDAVLPAWNKYGRQSYLWTRFKAMAGTVATLCVVLKAMPYAHRITVATAVIHSGHNVLPGLFAAFFYGHPLVIPSYIGLVLLYCASSILSDFVVPSLAIERITVDEALYRISKLLRFERGDFIRYSVIRLTLGTWYLFLAVLLFHTVFFVLAAVLGIFGYGAGLLLHMAAGISWAVLSQIGIVLGVLLYLLCAAYGMVLLLGAVLTFLESYAMYFLGGRYPRLGEMLDRSMPLPKPAPFVPPPNYMPSYTPPRTTKL